MTLIAKILTVCEVKETQWVRPIITKTNEGKEVDGERVEELRKGVHRDYDGPELGTEVFPNPPDRGPDGTAYIPLKEGAVPTRQRPFVMHGERLEGHKAVTKQWREKRFIERPPRGVQLKWLSTAFVVSKKDGTHRGL